LGDQLDNKGNYYLNVMKYINKFFCSFKNILAELKIVQENYDYKFDSDLKESEYSKKEFNLESNKESKEIDPINNEDIKSIRKE
jgi:hypothetical protein